MHSLQSQTRSWTHIIGLGTKIDFGLYRNWIYTVSTFNFKLFVQTWNQSIWFFIYWRYYILIFNTIIGENKMISVTAVNRLYSYGKSN